MSKLIYVCISCGTEYRNAPQQKSSFCPHPRNVCQCEEVLDAPWKYEEVLVPDSYYNGLPRLSLHPNYLDD